MCEVLHALNTREKWHITENVRKPSSDKQVKSSIWILSWTKKKKTASYTDLHSIMIQVYVTYVDFMEKKVCKYHQAHLSTNQPILGKT